MPSVRIEHDALVAAAVQMPEKELDRFVSEVFTLRAHQKAQSLNEQESRLLIRINEGLPESLQDRLNELIGKRKTGTLNEKERRELKKLTDRVELFDAERLGYLTELARLRNVPLRKLVRQLGLVPVSHD